MKASKVVTVVFCTGLVLSLMMIGSGGFAAEKQITLKYGHVMPPTHITQKEALWIKSELATRSNGKINLEIHPAETLGNVLEMFEACMAGTLDMTEVHGPVSRFWETFGVIDFPYIISDWEHWKKVFLGPPGKELVDGLLEKTGVRVIGWQAHSFRNTLSAKPIPILEVKDMKGLKIRLHANPVAMGTFKALGASPIPMSYGEIYTSLSSGVIDAMEGTPMSMNSGKFAEVAKYLAHTQHFFLTDSIAISEKRLKSLPPDMQKIVLEVGKDSQYHMLDSVKDENAKAWEKVRKQIKWETYPDLRSFAEAVKPTFEKMAKDIGAGDWVKKVEKLK